MDDIANVFNYFAGLADKDGGERLSIRQFQTLKVKLLKNLLVLSLKLHLGIILYYKRHGRLRQH